MCGIHGFCWQDTDESVVRMITAAHHRGPDGSGSWGDSDLTLGHNLLAIADQPELSAQPWHHQHYVLNYNGEIYNYRDLRKSLKYDFRTDSDTEVLAVGLAEHGFNFLHRLDGMFALAFYDRETQRLILARDTNGAKPLYYGYLKGRMAFSSEIRSLLELGFDRKVNKDAFRHYYHSGLVAGHLTMFEGISKFIPGEVVEIDLNTGTETRSNLNDRPLTPYAGKIGDIPALLSAKLRQAVNLTMTGRREIGLFLSGGMDSSSILHEAVEGLRLPIKTFTTRFETPHPRCQHNSDADAAQFLAKVYNTEHSELLIGEKQWIDNLDKAVLALEEPRQGKSYPAYYACNQMLRQNGIIVTLSGDGGDELLMGYKHHNDPPFRNKLNALRAGHREIADPSLKITLNEQVEYLNSWLPKGGLTGDETNDFMYTECLHTLSEDFLIRNDKLGMAFSMEARFPMMCRVFRDFVRSIPGHMKHSPPKPDAAWDRYNKILLRKAYAGKLPSRITNKGKTGWRAPTDDWIIGVAKYPAKAGGLIRCYMKKLLADPDIRELFNITTEDVDKRYLNNKNHKGAEKPSGSFGAGPGLMSQKELFTVVMFAVWFKQFKMRLW